MSSNQRRFTRLSLEDTTVGVVDIESGIEFSGNGKDLSSEGLAFRAPMEPSVGADMQVVLRGTDTRLEPLRASFHVLRVTPVAQGSWHVAGTLHQL
ncbi:MAG: hypothetical protein GQE15_21505 [Archangiaceae bacterium]|nr:hypothetical protein [Archangiaceae bacterium]